ncbi:MAG: IclR family transcriptional regulator [Bacteroidales bacterium]|nr:IclR family transcriptional regulator [Bacteroidales bacterium]
MIRVIDKALNILELLASDITQEYPLGMIADALEMDKGTCSNIVKTLQQRGYVSQSAPRKGYKLGYMIYRLGDSFVNNEDLARLSIGTMERLAARFNESVLLSVLRQDKRITLYNTVPEQDLTVRTSREKPAYCATTGRMILSYLSSEELVRFIRLHGLPKAGEWDGVTSYSELLSELEKAREQGWRIDVNRNHIVGLGVPIWKGDKVVASLGIFLPEARFNGEIQGEMLQALIEAGEEIRSILSRPA